MWKKCVALEHGIDIAAVGLPAGDILSLEQYLPAVRGFQPRDDPQRGGLAASGRAEQGQKFPAFHLKAHAGEGLGRTKCFMNVL